MGQGRHGQPLDVVGDHILPAVHQRVGLRGPEQGERPPRAHPESQQRRAARGPYDRHHVIEERFLHAHLLRCRLEVGHLLGREHGLDLLQGRGAGALQDLLLVVPIRVADPDLEQEAIQLGLGERMGPLILQGILRGQDHEGTRQTVRVVVQRDLVLVHRLEEARLGLGRGPVDLVREDDVAEERARLEDELPGLPVVDGDAEDVGRQQVRCELDALEADPEGLGQSVRQRRLAHPGHVLDQEVPPGQQPDHRQPHHLGLAHEGPGDVELQPADQLKGCHEHAPVPPRMLSLPNDLQGPPADARLPPPSAPGPSGLANGKPIPANGPGFLYLWGK